MRTSLLSYFTLCIIPASIAQDIPTDVVGDTGWTFFSTDTIALVRAADGNAWTLQNLGSPNVANALNDASAFGHYYQWGRWTDGHAMPGSPIVAASTLSPNNPLGLGGGSPNFYFGLNPSDWWSTGSNVDTWQGTSTNETNGIDPCTALGDGWQLPSEADWTGLLPVEGVIDDTTAYSSNLKLVAAGHRDGQSGTMLNPGVAGQYWSNTPSGPYAKALAFNDFGVNPSDDGYRSHGMSVRCLHKNLHVGVPVTVEADRPSIVPNPTNGNFTVDLGARIIERLDVFAPDGRLAFTVSPRTGRAMVTIDGAVNGVYALRISAAEGISWHTVVVAH